MAVENLGVEYMTDAGPVIAVDGVSFHVDAGETVGLVGESGSGKTSLALALMGLLPLGTRVTGRVILAGRDVYQLTPRELARMRGGRLGMVFQNSLEVLNPVMRVVDQVAEPLLLHLELARREARRRAEDLLSVTGLDSRWHLAYPHQLSGGMRQRVLLAMALAAGPDLLIIDEPTTSVDPKARDDLLVLLGKLQRERGLAILLLSHDLDAVSRLAPRMMVMYAGRVVEEGPARAVLDHPRHPYTRGLLNACTAMDPYRDLWGIPGEAPAGAVPPGCAFHPRCTQAEQACLQAMPELAPPRALPGVPVDGRRVACHLRGLRILLRAEGLHKAYSIPGGRVPAVDGVSLEISEGEVVGLVGESGSGKSTVAQIIAGVVGPDAGKVYFRDRPLRSDVPRTRGGIQMVFQDPAGATSDRFRVRDAVAEPLAINHIGDPGERLARVREALQAVRLPAGNEFLERYMYELSGGQRQRVALARALLMEPKLLVADEVTSMLDPSTQANLLRLLKGLQNSHGFAMLFVTHALAIARKVADRLVVLHAGRVVEEGSASRVIGRPDHVRTAELVIAAIGRFGEAGDKS